MNRAKALRYIYFAVAFVTVFLFGMLAGVYVACEVIKQALREERHQKIVLVNVVRSVEVRPLIYVTFQS